MNDPLNPLTGSLPSPSMSVPGLPPPLPLPNENRQKGSSARHTLAQLLSLTLIAFALDASLSLLDDGLTAMGVPPLLRVPRMILGFLVMAVVCLFYLALAVSPMLPTRPIALMAMTYPLSLFALLPYMVYWPGQLQKFQLISSLIQFAVACWIWKIPVNSCTWRERLVREENLQGRALSWRRLLAFVSVHLFVLLPVVVALTGFLAAVAVDRYTQGFVSLHLDRLSMHASTYRRPDGKTVHLVPMIHIGDSSFYDQVGRSIPSNSIVLLEGVSDEKQRLKRPLSYKKAANSLGLTEQKDNFAPKGGESRNADVDISDFSEESIGFLELATAMHSDEPTLEELMKLLQKSQRPELLQILWKDLLEMRNDHVLKEARTALAEKDHVVVPWGAMHMPGISASLLKEGFQLESRQEFTAIRFRRASQTAQPTSPH